MARYPKNLYDMIQNVHKKHKWEAFAQEVIPAVHKLIQDQDSSVIFCFCKSGRHRSVANAKLFQEIIKDETEIVHLSDGPNWKHLCGICDLCSWKDNDAQKQAEDAIDAATEKWHEYVPKVWIRKDQTQRRLGDDGIVVEEPIPEGTAQASDPPPGATPKSGATAPEPLPKPIPRAPPQFLKDHADPPGTAGADPSMGTAGADPSETAQTFTLETDQGNKVAVYDFRPQLSDLDEKELEKACFLVLSRVYSVFSPAKLSEVTSLMAKYTDHVALICAVTHKYLQYDAASALITALVADLRSGARTEKDWRVDLELAKRSLDQAILQLDTDAKDTPGDPAGDQTAQAADQAEPVDMDYDYAPGGGGDGGGSSADRPQPRDRTRSAQADRSKGKPKGKGKGKQRASSRAPGPQTHTVSDPSSVQHAEFRHDLASLGENPNEPLWLTDDYLDQVVAGHKKHGDAAFKQWLHPGGRHEGGPPVRVSFRAYPGNSWDKVPDALRRYRKCTAVQWGNTSTWESTREPEAPLHADLPHPPDRRLGLLRRR